jgi:hypothetical protein
MHALTAVSPSLVTLLNDFDVKCKTILPINQQPLISFTSAQRYALTTYHRCNTLCSTYLKAHFPNRFITFVLGECPRIQGRAVRRERSLCPNKHNLLFPSVGTNKKYRFVQFKHRGVQALIMDGGQMWKNTLTVSPQPKAVTIASYAIDTDGLHASTHMAVTVSLM